MLPTPAGSEVEPVHGFMNTTGMPAAITGRSEEKRSSSGSGASPGMPERSSPATPSDAACWMAARRVRCSPPQSTTMHS